MTELKLYIKLLKSCVKMDKFSFVTNATKMDGGRLSVFLPIVLQVFGDFIDEVLVILDTRPEEGRIKKLHKNASSAQVSVEEVCASIKDFQIRLIELDYSKIDEISEKWFGVKGVNRCQAGTPIFAFLYGIEQCQHSNIIRSDCDILYCNLGMIDEIQRLSKKFDLIQFPFLNDGSIAFSTRSFYINRERVYRKLPLKLHKLDFLRTIKRAYSGKPNWLALEQILDAEILMDHLQLHVVQTSKGYTMHIPSRGDFVGLQPIAERFVLGKIPERQLKIQHDYKQTLWSESLFNVNKLKSNID